MKRNTYSLIKSLTFTLSVYFLFGLLVITSQGVTQAQYEVLIDSFAYEQEVVAQGSAMIASSSVAGSQMLGGERDILAQKLSGGLKLDVHANPSGAQYLSHSQDSDVRGYSLIAYDGYDGDGATVDYEGLGGVDLTNGGRQNLIHARVIFDDLPVTVKFTVYSDSGNSSSYVLNLPGLIVQPRDFFIPFGNFVNETGAGAAFNSVGALTVEILGNYFGTDLIIDYFQTATTGAIGDYVWFDSNLNGLQETNESGISNVTVELRNEFDQVIATTQTDVTGYYGFFNLDPGIYYVAFTLPTGYAYTSQNEGSDDAIDSDPDSVSGISGPIELSFHEIDLSIDAGLYQLAGVGNYIWNDTDRDGIQDVGESGIGGVTVNLFDNFGTLIGTTVTSSSGYYEFVNLEPGYYYIEFVPPQGLVFSSQDQGVDDTIDSDVAPATNLTEVFYLEAGEVNNTIDAGLYQAVTAPGTGTPGYWKNHPQAWPVETIEIGGIIYTKAVAITLLGTPERGDKTYTMFRNLVCAKLNVLVGNEADCIQSIIPLADAWMATYGPVGNKVSAKSTAWSIGQSWATTLDKYNNGLLCAPHRD